jgi:hypothetical protein
MIPYEINFRVTNVKKVDMPNDERSAEGLDRGPESRVSRQFLSVLNFSRCRFDRLVDLLSHNAVVGCQQTHHHHRKVVCERCENREFN